MWIPHQGKHNLALRLENDIYVGWPGIKRDDFPSAEFFNFLASIQITVFRLDQRPKRKVSMDPLLAPK